MDLIGVDIGGTKIEAIRVDSDYRELERRRIGTPADYAGVIDAVSRLVCGMREGGEPVGVCAPGITGTDGLIRNSNTRCLAGRPLESDLSVALGVRVRTENDANCFALAESVLGAACGAKTVFGVIMGTGVGGGIIHDGTIHRGRGGLAGEWGHHILYRDGNDCYCGKRGCTETYISGPALEARWYAMTKRREPLRDIVAGSSPDHIKWKEKFLDDFGAALADVIVILDPDVIVLGGGVSNVPFLYGEGKRRVYERVFGGEADTPILQNKLGDSAGVFGACIIAN